LIVEANQINEIYSLLNYLLPLFLIYDSHLVLHIARILIKT